MEYWDLYNEDKQLLGKTIKRGEKLEEGEYHLVVGIWTVTPKGEILLTQRHPDKDWGLLWECSGGGVRAGESSLEGAVRELKEEIGVEVTEAELQFMGSLRTKHYFVDSYLYVADIDLKMLKLQKEEVVDAKLVTLEEFEAMNKEELIVEAMVAEFRLYQDKLLEHI